MDKFSTQRFSNIELLRIIAMAMIIAAHLSLYGGAYYHTEGVDKFFASLFLVGGKMGVALFVMIGSIFMLKKRISFKGVFRLFFTTTLVCFFCISVMIVLGKTISLKSAVIHSPINMYWFVSVYIGLYVISPWLNKLIDAMNFKSYRNLCVILTLLCVVCPTLRITCHYTNEFVWFVYLYFIVGFALKYKEKIKSNKYLAKAMYFLTKSYPWTTGGGVSYPFLGLI